MKYQKYKLKNGLRVILAPMQDTETVTVLVMTGVGSRYETKKENGLSHFLEHMMFKGTVKRPTAMDIAKELDGMGAEYNAFTGKEYTGYYAKVEKHHWETALDIVSDVFLNAKLEQEEIDREKGTIIQEINMYEDSPMRNIGNVFEEHLYGDQPLGWNIAGPKDNIKAFKRSDFLKYLKRGYVAENIVIGVAGKIEPKKVRKEIEKHFTHINTAKRPIFKKAKERQSKPEFFIQEKKTDQTHLLMGVRAFDCYHKDRYVLSVLATILGGGMSSRLFTEVRERRGLVYNISTSPDLYHDAGYLATQANTGHDTFFETVRIILQEYKKMATEKVGEEELKKAKEYIKGKIAMSFEGSDDVVEYLVGQEITRNKIVLPQEKMKAIDKVTADDVLRVAKDIFVNKKLNLTAIGKRVDKKKLEKLLQF